MSTSYFTILISLVLLLRTGSAEQECNTVAIDLVFVIDDSNSIGSTYFKQALTIADSLTGVLEVGNGIQLSRVGVVIFDTSARLGFRLDDFYSNADAIAAIDESEFLGGSSKNIAYGMNFALTQVLDYHQNHTGYRPGPRVMVIMSDGHDESDVTTQQKKAAAEGIIIYAIGIGSGVSTNQLTRATGDANNVYTTSNWSNLKKTINQVCHEVATTTPSSIPALKPASCGCEDDSLMDGVKYWLDIIFVIDSSNGVSDNDFKGVKSLISSFGNIQIGPTSSSPQQYSRVAIVNTGVQAEVLADLTTFTSGAELKKTVQEKLVKQGTWTFNVQAGLEAAQRMLQEEEAAHRRPNVRKVVVLFSTLNIDCRSSQSSRSENKDMDILCSLISVMEGEKTTLVTVGLKLAGAADYPLIDVTDKCNILNNTVDMMMDMLRALCRANCYCLSPYTQFTVKDKCESYAECMYVQEISLSYPSAVETCKSEEGFVADVLSEDKDEFLKEMHLNSSFFPYWVGLRKQGSSYVWDDGQTQGPSDYAPWCTSKGQPDASKGDCVYEAQCAAFGTGWFNAKCGAMLPTYFYSCQKTACSVNQYCDFV